MRALTFTFVFSAMYLLWGGNGDTSAQENTCIGESHIWNENDELVVLHYHDWRDTVGLAGLYSDSHEWTRYFSEDNKWAYVELRDKKTTKTSWRVPSIALNNGCQE